MCSIFYLILDLSMNRQDSCSALEVIAGWEQDLLSIWGWENKSLPS